MTKKTLKMKFSKAIIGAIICALAASSCIKGTYHSSFTAYCTFEAADTSAQNNFINGVFKANDFYMGDGSLAFCGKRTDDGEFRGGMMVGIRKDCKVEKGYVPQSLYTVVDSTGGAGKSIGFGIFMDSKTAMPDHEVVFTYRAMGTCSLADLYVNNTTYVANAVKFGFSGIPAFSQGDYLTLKITGYLNDSATGTATLDLAKYDGNGLNLVTKWTKIDVSKIGMFDYLDFSLETNRYDLPLYCCIDNLIASVSIES